LTVDSYSVTAVTNNNSYCVTLTCNRVQWS